MHETATATHPVMRIITLLLCGVTVLSSVAAAAQGGRLWWTEPAIQRNLNLSAAQVARLGAIFGRDLPARRSLHEKIRRLDAALARAISDDDDKRVIRLSAELEALRTQQHARRSLMLLEMYRTLTPSQRRRLRTLDAVERPTPD
jgi:Spy/CpxP family protein refolding chaperone